MNSYGDGCMMCTIKSQITGIFWYLAIKYTYFMLRNIQQNSYNWMINNLGNPENLALEESSSKTGSFAYHQKNAPSMKQVDHKDMIKRASNSSVHQPL
jgi:hypothetical protein